MYIDLESSALGGGFGVWILSQDTTGSGMEVALGAY